MNKYKFILRFFTIVFILIFVISCAAKKAYYNSYISKPENAIIKVDYKAHKKKFKKDIAKIKYQYKKKIINKKKYVKNLKELKKIWKKESPVFKEEYKLYKKRISYLENEWDYYEKLRKSLSKNDFKNVNFYYSRLIKYHEKVKDTIAFEEYYNGAVYYYGFSKIKLYKFKEGLDVLSNIPENSYFYDLALDLANKVMNDSDGDGYIDEWEILDGFNPMNPYSHP